MGCFSCFLKHAEVKNVDEGKGNGNRKISAKSFAFRDLAAATDAFSESKLIGEGGFGRVYRGRLDNGQIVAVKRLDQDGIQGNKEFIVEVLMLSLVHHSNLVHLIGYCADGDQRLLVYEYMSKGSLERHLFDLTPDRKPLEWNTRIKIAIGAARGVEYLHCKADPPVIYRDLKSENILLDDDFNPKLSDFGLAKLGPVGDNTHVSTRVMGTYGYCAPEYAMSGKLTIKSDVYGFGVVLLELITGRRSIDPNRVHGEQNLVKWARPLLNDRKIYTTLVDPRLKGRYPFRALCQAFAITAMCLCENPHFRPFISDVLAALEYLGTQPYNPKTHSNPSTSSPLRRGRLAFSPTR